MKSVTAVTVIIGLEDLRVHQEVDVDRRVVLRDAGLLRHLEEALAEIDLDRLLDERDQEHDARPAGALQPSEEEHDQAFVLAHDVNDAENTSQSATPTPTTIRIRPTRSFHGSLALRCSPIAG